MEIRSFLAFELPQEFKEIISQVLPDMKKSLRDVRWLMPANIHLTIVFMGSVPSEQIKPVGERVAKVCMRHKPFNVSLGGAGLFSGRRIPKVIWISLAGDIARMSRFRNDLHKALLPFGIKREKRRFSPHLTLGRFRRGARTGKYLDDFLVRYRDITSPMCKLNELILFQSNLKPDGAVYTRLMGWPLST